jgi:hypothetical protein
LKDARLKRRYKTNTPASIIRYEVKKFGRREEKQQRKIKGRKNCDKEKINKSDIWREVALQCVYGV